MTSRMYKPTTTAPAPDNGRTRPRLLTDEFGAGCPICPHCSALNPFSLHSLNKDGSITPHDPPTHCKECDNALSEDSAE